MTAKPAIRVTIEDIGDTSFPLAVFIYIKPTFNIFPQLSNRLFYTIVNNAAGIESWRRRQEADFIMPQSCIDRNDHAINDRRFRDINSTDCRDTEA